MRRLLPPWRGEGIIGQLIVARLESRSVFSRQQLPGISSQNPVSQGRLVAGPLEGAAAVSEAPSMRKEAVPSWEHNVRRLRDSDTYKIIILKS